jgi:hypothetical protein
MKPIQEIENSSDAPVRTGPLKIGDDWPGVFIRGDEALGYVSAIRAGLSPAKGSALDSLLTLLASCKVERS